MRSLRRKNQAIKSTHKPIKGTANACEFLEKRVLLSSQPYTFQNAAIGGGGFVDGVFFSPTQQNVIYVRTDIGGLYKTTNGGTNWNQLLDFVGPAVSPFGFYTNNQDIGVLSFAIDPQNPNNIYADVGEYSGTNGAILYSTDGGVTWGEDNLSFYVGGNSQGRGEGERLAVDPYNSNILYLGTNSNGLWKSTNSGRSFSQVTGTNISTSASINFVYFNPYSGTVGTPTSNIFVGINSTAGLSPQTTAAEPTNLYQTTDAGTTWNAVAGSTTSPGRNVQPTTITSLSRSGTTATAHTSIATAITPGDMVTIAGATPTAYNGTYTVNSVSNSTTFTYTVATGSDSATGTITAAVNYSDMPNHAALSSDGNLYLTYSDAQAPNGTQTTGGVYRYNTTTGVWAAITPEIPGLNNNSQFGYMGLALDPENSTTIVVTTINDYSGPDKLWRTATANATIPTWVQLYSTSSAQNNGYGGYDTTRNTTTAPWIAGFGDGIGNWPCSVAIDPFSSGHILYGDGQGLWATNIGNSNSPLTAANSWYFPDKGIEFTADISLTASGYGTPLFSALGDIAGFAHTTLTSSPPAGNISNTYGPIDFDQANPNYVVDLGSGTNGGVYSTNNGSTWTAFKAEAGSGGGSIAVSTVPSPGQPIYVWSPSGSLPYHSTNNSTSWIASTMPTGTATGGRIISDRVAANTFYYTTSSSGQFYTYKSTDGGVTFTLVNQLATYNPTLYASPITAGDLWVADSSGVHHSTNYGTSYSLVSGGVQTAYALALGAPAPGRSNAAVYIWGQIGGVYALYRSDDAGTTFVRINDAAHQWGGGVAAVVADPKVFGRVYVGVNGRGIIIGNPTGTLPTGWSDADINTPGNPGYASNSTNLSTGTVVNQWAVNGGGAGITGTSDQFNFVSEPITGNNAIVAQIGALDNPGTGIPQAGVMFRATGTNATDVFAALVQTTSNNLIFEYRTTTAGSITLVTSGTVPIGSEYVELVRTGNSFSAEYGTDGIHWTQLGTSVTLNNMPATASAGLAVTASYNPQLAAATFTNVQVVAAPTIATAASASPSTVTGTTTNLGVTGADVSGESTLTYTWAATGPAAVTFSVNGTNAAKNTFATFHAAGSYSFTVTATDSVGQSVTSTLSVSVTQTVTTITLNPASTSVNENGTTTFSASGTDQFNLPLTTQPAFTYSVSAGIGTINSTSGLYTAPALAGTATIVATSGSASGSSAVTVNNANPAIATPASASPSPVTGTAATLSVTASDDGGTANLIYTWVATTLPAGATAPSIAPNGSNVAATALATFTQAGSYTFTVTVSDGQGGTNSSAVSVTVNQTLTTIAVTPISASLNENATQTFSASGYDQFGLVLVNQPVFSWTKTSGIGSINPGTGVYTSPGSTGNATVQATSGAVSGSASVTVINASPTIVTPAAASPTTTTSTVALSVLGADDSGENNLTYTWAVTTLPTGATAPAFSINGTNAAKNTVATLVTGGSYVFTVTVSDGQGGSVTSTVSVNEVPVSYSNPIGNNVYAIRIDPAHPSIEQIFVNVPETTSPSYTIALSQLSTLLFTPPAGDGSLTIDFANGNPLPSGGVTYTGGNTLYIKGTPSGSMGFTINDSQITDLAAASSPINYSSLQQIQFDLQGGSNTLTQQAQPGAGLIYNAGAGSNTLTVNSGYYSFGADPQIGSGSLTVNDNSAISFTAAPAGGGFAARTLYALNIGANATATLLSSTAITDRTLLQLNTVSIAVTGTLDQGSNDLLLHSASLSTITSLVQSGLNQPAGYWNGPGITSSAARADTTYLTALGEMSNNNAGAPIYSTFDGQPAVAADTLVKYTYFGDANLDGKVDGSDYSRIDNAMLTSATGWSNGDFNYDGAVDGSDYTLIDNAFNMQGASLTAVPASQLAVSAKATKLTPSRPGIFSNAAPITSAFITGSWPDQAAVNKVNRVKKSMYALLFSSV